MVCRGINSICPIHAFLLSCSVQATGGGSCWAVLLGLISKGYKLHYPAQSEPARTTSSFSLSPSLLFSRCWFLWRPPSVFPSSILLLICFWVGDWCWLSTEPFSISFHRNTYIDKQTQPMHGWRCQRTQTHTRARQKQQREPRRFNGKTSHSVWVRQH